MYLKNILQTIFGLSFFFFNTSSNAQTRNELWTKINITKSIRKQFDVGLDMQHRRQNGFGDDKNMFHYGMTSSIRLWTYYKLKHNWVIIFSPIAYFDNQAIKNNTEKIVSYTEFRAMLGTSKIFIVGKLINKNRFLYEFSSVNSGVAPYTRRQRYILQNAFKIPFYRFKNKSDLNYSIANDIFVKTINSNTTFDQDRLYNGIQWKGLQCDISAGYQWTIQKDGNTSVKRNQLVLVLNINL